MTSLAQLKEYCYMIKLSDDLTVYPYDYGWELHQTTKHIAKSGKKKGEEVERMYFSSIEQCVFFAMGQGLKKEEISNVTELYETQARMFKDMEARVREILK